MNVKTAANDMIKHINNSELPCDHPEYGKEHLLYMVASIISNDVFGEKAHRWIGWVQGCVCVGKGATLEEMKNINFKA